MMPTLTDYLTDLEAMHHVELWGGDDNGDFSPTYHSRRERRPYLWALPLYVQSGDYHPNGTVGTANVRSFLELVQSWAENGTEDLESYDAEESGLVSWRHEGYGAELLVLRLDVQAPDDVLCEIINVLRGLEDYPLIDDEVHSAVEMETVEESWESWARSEFVRDLERIHEVNLDDVHEDAIRDLYYNACKDLGDYPYPEGSGDVCFPSLTDKHRPLKVDRAAVLELPGAVDERGAE